MERYMIRLYKICLGIQYRAFLHTVPPYFPMYALCTVAVAREDAAEAAAELEAAESTAIFAVASEAEAAGVVATEVEGWNGVEAVVGGKEVGGHTVELVDTAAPGSLANEEVAGAAAAA